MNVDEIFKVPAVPTGKNKRKLPAEPDQEWLNRYREQSGKEQSGESSNSSNGIKRRNVTLEDEEDVEDTFDGTAYEEEEDEGRFYGGGLTEQQKKVLDLLDETEDEPVESMSIQTVKKLVLKFERAINKNQEMRVKFPDDPTKFMESEADLDESIKALLQLTEVPHLYPELIKLEFVQSLVGLLVHENTDIVIDVIEVLNELTDEDIGTVEEAEEEDENLQENIAEGLKEFVDALMTTDILPILTNILGNLNEDESTDYQGVFNTLGIFENFVSCDPSLAEKIVAETTLMEWLLKRIKYKTFDSNKQYTTEVLSILLQNSRVNRLKLGELGGIDILLQALNQFKRKDPNDADEEEMMENLFDAICSTLQESENKLKFLMDEGVELMVIMMKEKVMARIRSLKVLNHALSGPEGAASCIRFVEILGLKTLFSTLMRKGLKKLKKAYKQFSESEEEEHVIGIIVSLFRNIPPDTLQRLRLLNKFRESDYEKVDRLLEMKESYEAKLHHIDVQIEEEQQEMLQNNGEIDEGDKEDFYLRRLEAGLFTLQMVCLVLLWVSDEDLQIKQHVKLLLERKDDGIASLRKIITEYVDNIGDNGDTAIQLLPSEDGEPPSSNSKGNTRENADTERPDEMKENLTQERTRVLGLLDRF